MKKYLFVDEVFEIDCGKGFNGYPEFETQSDKCIAKISVGNFAEIGTSTFGVEYVSKPYAHILRSASDGSSMLFSNDDWSESFVCSGNNGEYSEELMITSVYSALCKFRTLFLHASVIDLNGQGIVFVGPSGIGKTTQAELWKKVEGADILNGDKVFIRNFDKGVFAYGSPWKGSSSYFANKKTLLKGVVVLKQGKINRIRRVDLVEAIETFMPHVFLPHWDEECMKNALATLDDIINVVPIWMLECQPDGEAVKITKESVLGE
ncbi:MAG: hypothetical protein E7547_05100 [Ruminococcaceae bacterium]|nr:hypothetical protein [Oscillospiraceae bacterium]